MALAERDGAGPGLAAVEQVQGLTGYPLWHAARADLLTRLGRDTAAGDALDAALALPLNAAQRRHLTRLRAARA
jgi:RNA polymerase sigma-70 factor (ECF subfamily)